MTSVFRASSAGVRLVALRCIYKQNAELINNRRCPRKPECFPSMMWAWYEKWCEVLGLHCQDRKVRNFFKLLWTVHRIREALGSWAEAAALEWFFHMWGWVPPSWCWRYSQQHCRPCVKWAGLGGVREALDEGLWEQCFWTMEVKLCLTSCGDRWEL